MESSEVDESVGFYPEYGDFLPDGRLRVKTIGRDSSGEVWDGYVDIEFDDPRYQGWAERIRNKGKHFAQQAQAVAEARRQRRDAKIIVPHANPEVSET